MNRHMHQEPNFLDRAVGAVERGAAVYGAAKTLYNFGRGAVTVGRYMAPMLGLL